MILSKHLRLLTSLIILTLFLTSCAQPTPLSIPTALPSPTSVVFPVATSTPPGPLRLSFSPVVPQGLRDLLSENQELLFNGDSTDFELELKISNPGDAAWVYALVAPFPTVADGVTFTELQNVWQGKDREVIPAGPLLMSAETRSLLTAAWGSSDGLSVEVLPATEITTRLWADAASWGIIPFEELSPRLKVLSIDDLSPMSKGLDLAAYPLAFSFGFTGDAALRSRLEFSLQGVSLTNRDERKMTTVLMTGVTALSRRIAMTMNEKGVLYPGENIAPLMQSADITHLSNEVSFFTGCPPPRETFQRFCSDPSYIQLLQHIGVDVVELTGNHLVDYGAGSMLESLELYRQNGFKFYGGGENLQEASQPLLIEDHGNKIAFMGCNFVGPENDWATDSQPGTNPCSADPKFDRVKKVVEQGYNVIYTIQFIEDCQVYPLSAQRTEFRLAAEAGAAMVIGSQAHCPQGVRLVGDQFIHYGLGNLFFDQMMELNRLEFLDWAVFYNGKLLGVDLVTAKLYDYSQPALTTDAERAKLLNLIFKNSEWK